MKRLTISVLMFAFVTLFTMRVYAAPAEITWYGHAAFKVVTPNGKVLLVDPWITNPANKNGSKDLEALTKADLILLTHGHTDHIGDSVEIAKRTKANLVGTFDLMKAMVSYKGFPEKQAERTTTGSFGGEIKLLEGEVVVKFIPAMHGGSMDTQMGPIYAGQPGGFLISVKNGPQIYHTGDTDIFSDMPLLTGNVDLLLVCIGDKFTMGPVMAAKSVSMIKPRMVVPMHYATYPILTGTPEQFRIELTKLGLASLFMQMKVGETLVWR